MRPEDKFSLNINTYLNQKYNELSCKVGPYSNIIGIFYHELIIYFTNYYLINNSEYEYNQKIEFPYLNTDYCNKPFLLSHSIANARNTSLKQLILLIVVKLRHLLCRFYYCKSTVGVLAPNYFFLNNIISLPLYIRINLFKNKKVYITKYEYQFSFLKNILLELCGIYKIPEPIIFVENFLNYVKQFITDKQKIFQYDYLIVESNSVLNYRINGANALFQNKYVISFAHGDASAEVLDNPLIGYGELSYCTHYIDYGSKKLTFGENNLPLHNPPIILKRSSSIIKKYYRECSIRKEINHQTYKGLYIPTGFSENRRYGPFRDIDDRIYINWQNAIFDSSDNIYYKPYPGQKKIVNISKERIIEGDLKKNIHILNKYDLIIIDYFSTVSNLVVATDKPIIYFNLGLRNIACKAKKDFKERVFWCDVDLSKDYSIQVQNGFKNFFQSEQSFVNNYTKKYSLNNEYVSELDLIKDIIRKK